MREATVLSGRPLCVALCSPALARLLGPADRCAPDTPPSAPLDPCPPLRLPIPCRPQSSAVFPVSARAHTFLVRRSLASLTGSLFARPTFLLAMPGQGTVTALDAFGVGLMAAVLARRSERRNQAALPRFAFDGPFLLLAGLPEGSDLLIDLVSQACSASSHVTSTSSRTTRTASARFGSPRPTSSPTLSSTLLLYRSRSVSRPTATTTRRARTACDSSTTSSAAARSRMRRPVRPFLSSSAS